MHLPACCMECGLYEGVKTWNVQPQVDTRPIPALQTKPYVLFVGQAPGRVEDETGRAFSNDQGAGGFLHLFLERLEARWIVDNSVRCYPGRDPAGGGDNKPSAGQITLCGQNFLSQTIQTYRPAVVVCLGVVAMKAIMGKAAFKSLQAASRAPIKLEGFEPYVLITQHPVMHVTGRMPLLDEYKRLFHLIEELVTTGPRPPEQVNFEVISQVARAMEVERLLGPRISLDTEAAVCEENPERRTRWHPGSEILSCSVGNRQGDQIFNYVLVPPALNVPNVLRSWIHGRIVDMHNAKHDIQDLWEYLGIDVFVVARGIQDTMMRAYLPNQAKVGNSLKTLNELHFGTPDWSKIVWSYVDAANERIQAHRTEVAKEIKAWHKANGSPRIPGVGPNGGMPKPENLDEAASWMLERGYLVLAQPLRPAKSADFSDVPLDVLAEYNARDTLATEKLNSVLPSVEAGTLHPDAYALALRNIETLSYVERQGLGVDLERFAQLKVAVRERLGVIHTMLLHQPEVQRALASIPKIQESYRKMLEGKNKGFLEDLYAQASPKSNPFLVALAQETDVIGELEITDAGNYSIDKEKLAELAGPEQGKTRAQWLWWYIWRLRELSTLESTFLKEIEHYTVDGRIHTDFKMAKVELQGRAAGSDQGGGAITGRLSSANPNLQNIKHDQALRWIFRPPSGKIIVELDYDRIEPVVLTVVAGISAWETIFCDGLDLYRVIANQVFHLGIPMIGTPQEVDALLTTRVTKEHRNSAKTRTLAIMYDEAPKSFAQRAGIPEDEAKVFYENFDMAFPEIPAYKQRLRDIVAAGMMVTTPFGRQRGFHITGNRSEDGRQNRMAINFPIQSTASDITCWKAFEVRRWIQAHGLEGTVSICNLVHDSLWLEVTEPDCRVYTVPGKDGKPVTKIHAPNAIRMGGYVANIMEDMSTLPFSFRGPARAIPLRCTIKAGPDLSQMVELSRKEWAVA